MRKLCGFIAALALLLIVAGCGGGGSDSDPIPRVIGEKGPAGGWVFNVTDGGLHGLEASLVNLTTAPWGCSGSNLQGAEGTAVGTGAANTLDILNFCPQTPIAADVAIFYTLNGFSDWFLPSIDELELMYLNIGQGSTTIGNVGGFSNIPYWSSSEVSSVQAWSRNFSNGISGVSRKTDAFGVRAARVF